MALLTHHSEGTHDIFNRTHSDISYKRIQSILEHWILTMRMEYHRQEQAIHQQHCHRLDKFRCGCIGHPIPLIQNSQLCWPFSDNSSITISQRLHWIKVRMVNLSIVVSPHRAKCIPNAIRCDWMPAIQTMTNITSHAWISFDRHRHQLIDSVPGSNWIKQAHSSMVRLSTAQRRRRLKCSEQVSWCRHAKREPKWEISMVSFNFFFR